ncbi:hypothetical protein HN858_00830 [Candidatus Falkowbacteria bacterium]|jgi:hypothetical protein|nr:hypothetical protein [Candidatus Falkowbacteria bacterium]MBT5503511.1 hypothetical protein [Candidatus Falkowbacteria bacterium]MBT6573983.1 hypothetical protein [Candidatus Falkowbacteria bacterium]MBT7348198.1 hypothetical protein [Candidatus Falkowbacteria bacterium]MBT7500177.1 hypothetical protein [Candidatus Falkowbacteria bacterium]
MSESKYRQWFRKSFWRSNKDSKDGIAEVNDGCVQAVLDFVNKHGIGSSDYKIVPITYGRDGNGDDFMNIQLAYFAEEELK